jgi:hypothetical protein
VEIVKAAPKEVDAVGDRRVRQKRDTVRDYFARVLKVAAESCQTRRDPAYTRKVVKALALIARHERGEELLVQLPVQDEQVALGVGAILDDLVRISSVRGDKVPPVLGFGDSLRLCVLQV